MVIPMFTFYQWTGLYDTHVGLALLYQVHALLLFAVVAQKHIVKGMTLGAVKG